jgi:hypothetical protein
MNIGEKYMVKWHYNKENADAAMLKLGTMAD